MKGPILGVVVFGLFVLAKSSLYIVEEGQLAIVTQFGNPIGESKIDAGLYVKKPFVQEVRYVDKRILSWDGFPNQIPTKDKKYISVDTTARWKVVDPLKFIKSVKNEKGARSKLDAILDASTRNVISNQNLVEAVRNTNAIIKKTKQHVKDVAKRKSEGVDVIDEGITGELEPIKVGREKLSQLIVEGAKPEIVKLGIELIDVQLRRISYEKSVESKVYERMISERQRIAQKIRSIGQGEKEKIEGRISKDLKEIESVAYRKSQIIKGIGEAKSFKIYANALSRNPKFYEFSRTMDAYKKTMKPGTKLILSSDSEFLNFLR